MNAIADQRAAWAHALRDSALPDISVPPACPPTFEAWRLGGVAPAPPADAPVDVAVWSSLLGDAPDAAHEVIDPSGPLRAQSPDEGIELWTERDLCALHALWWFDHGTLRARALDAARWHIANTQPDNATNRPWALHVFLEAHWAHDDGDARLYAETLWHNCQVRMGRPDPLSAWVLADCADALQGRRPAQAPG